MAMNDSPLGTTRVGRNDNGILPIRYLLLDISHHARLGNEIFDAYMEKPLNLRGVKVHGDDVIGTGDSEEVGDQP